jgi:hypothetical protein
MNYYERRSIFSINGCHLVPDFVNDRISVSAWVNDEGMSVPAPVELEKMGSIFERADVLQGLHNSGISSSFDKPSRYADWFVENPFDRLDGPPVLVYPFTRIAGEKNGLRDLTGNEYFYAELPSDQVSNEFKYSISKKADQGLVPVGAVSIRRKVEDFLADEKNIEDALFIKLCYLRRGFSPQDLFGKTVFVSIDPKAEKSISIRFQGVDREMKCFDLSHVEIMLKTIGMTECLDFVSKEIARLVNNKPNAAMGEKLIAVNDELKLVFQMSPTSYVIVKADEFVRIKQMQGRVVENKGEVLSLPVKDCYFFDVANPSSDASINGVNALIAVTGEKLHIQINNRINKGKGFDSALSSDEIDVDSIAKLVETSSDDNLVFYPEKNGSQRGLQTLYYDNQIDREDSPTERSVDLHGDRGVFVLVVATSSKEGVLLSMLGPDGKQKAEPVVANASDFVEKAGCLCDLYAYGRGQLFNDISIRLAMSKIFNEVMGLTPVAEQVTTPSNGI